MSSMSSDISLEDESCEPCFSGATLSLSSNTGITDSNGNQSVVNNNNNTTPLNTTPLNTTPLNTVPLNTVAYNTMRSSLTQLDTDCNDFYGLREDLIERAIQDCKPVIINGMDGSLLCASLLTEIDYWDTEKERLIFVCDNSIIVMKYDLISLKLLEYQRYLWSKLDLIVIGELKYPSTSLIPSRNQFGIRLMWNKGRPLDFVNKWNPWSKSVPWLTLTSHPLALEFGSEVNTTKYDINHFNGFVVNAIQRYNSLKRDTNLNNNNNNINNNNNRDNSVNENEMQIVYQPIIIENYANVASAVYNLANMGFFKSRGTFSF